MNSANNPTMTIQPRLDKPFCLFFELIKVFIRLPMIILSEKQSEKDISHNYWEILVPILEASNPLPLLRQSQCIQIITALPTKFSSGTNPQTRLSLL